MQHPTPMPAFAPVNRPELVLLFVGEMDKDRAKDWTALEAEEGVVGFAVEEEEDNDDESEEILVDGAVEVVAPDEPRVKGSDVAKCGTAISPNRSTLFVRLQQRSRFLFSTLWQLLKFIPPVREVAFVKQLL